MNQVLFVIIVLVILYMFRDKWLKYMPDIVKKNVLVSGLVFGFALCWFMGNNIEGFDVTDPQEAIEFQGTCCNLYNGTLKTEFANENDQVACNENPENQAVKVALCEQGMRTRKFKGLVGAAANAQFKQTCCPTFDLSMEAGSDGDECFKYAFGRGLTENWNIGELMSDYNEFTEICS